MIVRIVKMSIAEGKLSEFKSIYLDVMEKIRHAEGCGYLELLEDKENHILITYSHWDSQLSLEKYRNSELFINTWRKVKPLFKQKAEAWTLCKQH